MKGHLMHRASGLIVGSLIFIAGCGGGGGGGAGTPPATGGSEHSVTFPNGITSVKRASGSVIAGGSLTIQIAMADPQVATVQVLIGETWETAVLSSATPVGGGAWSVSVSLPNPLPPAGSVLVRLIMNDGEIYENAVGELDLASF